MVFLFIGILLGLDFVYQPPLPAYEDGLAWTGVFLLCFLMLLPRLGRN
jgi:hypothetical protein